ncbi:hypothetical protein CYMTET_8943 [Cymbomonas tetramitiformis]|uniref:Uncharacterized protein n=1 Tax=Cymbomonas tetramitiformis TaxID=36881 RepID=A0AAE0F1B5_9CHLO|nr:hypothetical protein CYMTET_42112 [Cymbomonas tetramitiformis]KAK3283356.1 hypothetical protein CYMTET_8943 [Cymbomonas tetramitiformis]
MLTKMRTMLLFAIAGFVLCKSSTAAQPSSTPEEELQGRVASLETEILARDQKLSALQSEISTQEAAKSQLVSDLKVIKQKAEDELSSLQDEVAKSKSTIETLSQESVAAKKSAADSAAEVSDLRKRLVDSQAQQSSSEAELVELKSQILSLEKDIEQAKSAQGEYKQKAEHASADATALKQELETARSSAKQQASEAEGNSGALEAAALTAKLELSRESEKTVRLTRELAELKALYNKPLLEKLAESFSEGAASVRPHVLSAVEFVSTRANPLIAQTVDALKPLVDQLASKIESTWQDTKPALEKAWALVTAKLNDAKPAVTTALANAEAAMSNLSKQILALVHNVLASEQYRGMVANVEQILGELIGLCHKLMGEVDFMRPYASRDNASAVVYSVVCLPLLLFPLVLLGFCCGGKGTRKAEHKGGDELADPSARKSKAGKKGGKKK